MKTINIGGASGFWGDSFIAAPQLMASEKLDFLVFDYLAEITMSIMARQHQKDPEQGYATDFVTVVMRNILPDVARQNVKVISNAGGVNPEACARALQSLIKDAGLDLTVATVVGDDISHQVDELRKQSVREMFSGAEMPESFMSVNAYLGGFPIASALDKGADIVVTGRCVDSAVTLGSCIHAFGWTPDDYDKLAGGSLAGHIIECGAQATGGLFTDWERTGDWSNIGYPIAEVAEDGSFVVTKPDNTGGIVCPEAVAEQLVYEIGDPQAYILPDVVCDFSDVQIDQADDNRVQVTNTKGRQPTGKLKVSATYFDGFRIVCNLTIRGRDATGKAHKTAGAVLKRVRALLDRQGAPDFNEVHVELIGTESDYGPHGRIKDTREVILKLGAKHASREVLGLLLRELTSSATSMAPGTTGSGGNRPKPSPVVRLFSFLVDKDAVHPEVSYQGERWSVPIAPGAPFDPSTIERPAPPQPVTAGEETVDVPLITIAHGRSGDKGNDANIGVIARKPEFLPVIWEHLTPETVADYFGHLLHGNAERYLLPGIHAVNFVLHDVLGGGGIASLRQDPQGKAYAQMLLDIPIAVPKSLVDSAKREEAAAVSG